MKKLSIAVLALAAMLGVQAADAASTSSADKTHASTQAKPGMHKHKGWVHSHHYAKGHRHHRHHHSHHGY